ncbi:D-alanyl-D-alanine carboxypeptidase [Peribacillus deserti]|uniref:D-alanyl-D-alanine carboxypeptidase n=1 Tax=Peribacillus deserti TaxID=673318 RepID=A0ABS2QEM3_9BACI|nr:SH3 domain-containing protein [Peribacillus deserti]MBM7691591.1 D-alanyl-D-alanine carboxypeptidase [Peribacillus deserti]
MISIVAKQNGIVKAAFFAVFVLACAAIIYGVGAKSASAETMTYETTANVNIRTGPSTAYESLGTVAKGSQLNVTGNAANGWYQVSHNGQRGYVSGTYVQVKGFINTATSDLNVRTGPSTAYSILGTVQKGEELTVTGKANGWFKISYNGRTGYVSGKYVQVTEVMYAATANLNLRSGPSTASGILASIPKGTGLAITADAVNGWYKIYYNGKFGYVSAAYVKKTYILIVMNPESKTVLVNKQNKLPDGYTPQDLVYAPIPFTFSEQSDKRKMRKEAAAAIAQLFNGAKSQGVSLLGVSAYRSYDRQVELFNYYVSRDGYEKASTYSAMPGTSEHQTGLAIDVTGGNGQCAAQDCFANTPEAAWLEDHASEYGFIIRYQKGKESITGYKYEPWHLRYVGQTLAKHITSRGVALEEYIGL